VRFRTILSASALAVAGLLNIGLGEASAATLFTTTAHTTTVTSGAPVSATAVTPMTFASATSVLDICFSSALRGTVEQNSGGTVTSTLTSGSISSCAPFTQSITFPAAWRLTVSGGSTTAGGTTSWNASLTNFRLDLNNGPYSGNFTSGGVTAIQHHTSGPICIRFADAGTYTGPLTGNGRITTTYCFEGAGAAWSLG